MPERSRPPFDELFRDGRLRSHRVDRDDRSADVDQLQKFGNRRALSTEEQGIGFFRGRDLSQRQAEVRRPDADRMQRSQPAGPVVAASQRLAVNRQNRLFDTGGYRRLFTQGCQPTDEAGLKTSRVEDRQNSPNDILPRNAVGQLQQRQSQASFQQSPLGNRGWTICDAVDPIGGCDCTTTPSNRSGPRETPRSTTHVPA